MEGFSDDWPFFIRRGGAERSGAEFLKLCKRAMGEAFRIVKGF